MANLHVHFTTPIALADANTLAHALARHAVPDEGSFIRVPAGLFRVREVRRILALDAEFKEEQHKRDKTGEFTSGGAKPKLTHSWHVTMSHPTEGERTSRGEAGNEALALKAREAVKRRGEKAGWTLVDTVIKRKDPAQDEFNEGDHPRDKSGAFKSAAGAKFFSGSQVDNTYEDARDPKSRSTIVHMSPAEFLAMAEPGYDPDKAERVAGILKEHGAFNTLPHMLIDEHGKVIGHEGRHRMRALEERDIDKVPVELRSTMHRWGEHPELPTHLEAQGSKRRMPLPESQAFPKTAQDAWKEEQHPRGQPDNAGQFAKGGGGAKTEEPSAPSGSADLYERSRKLRVRLIAALKKDNKVLSSDFEVYERRPDDTIDWDKGAVDPETLSPAQRQLLERYKAAEAKLAEEIDKPPPPPPKLDAAHIKVMQITQPREYYNKLKEEATKTFHEYGMTLEITPVGDHWTPDRLRLIGADGERLDLNPTALSEPMYKLWKEVQEANTTASHGRPLVLNNEEAVKVTKIVADKLGYDTAKISYREDDRPFMLNGKEHMTGGLAYLDSGKIEIFTNHLGAKSFAGVLAHEIEHQQFQRVLDAYEAEQERMRKDALESKDPNLILKPDGTLRDEYKDKYPLYAALHAPLTSNLQKDDGITDYSREWWEAWRDHTADRLSAVHETMAEMSMLDWEGSLPRLLWYKQSKGFKPLYRAVKKFYPQIAAKAKKPVGDAEFDENKVKRDDDGKFATQAGGGGNTGGPMKKVRGAEEMPHAERNTAQPVYLRVGTWNPKTERSGNYAGTSAIGGNEAGVSVYKLDDRGQPEQPPDTEWPEDMEDRVRGDEPKLLVQGERVGYGGDGEPLLQKVRVVGEWKSDDVYEKVAEKTPGAKPAPQADAPGSAFTPELREQMKRLQGFLAKHMVPSAKQTLLIATKLAEHMGVATDKIKVDPGEPPKSRLGAGHQTQASSNSNTGEITFWPITMTAAELPGIAAHEMMHQKWDKVLAAYTADNPEVKKLLTPHVTGSVYLRLKKEDGATPYSKLYWVARAAGHGSLILAMHETLAEIARLDLEGQFATVKARWRNFYAAVNKAHALLAKSDA